MPYAWKWKSWTVIATACLSGYLLLPSLLGLPEKRAALEAAGQPLPAAYHLLPAKGLSLGLDLQGGIYVEFQVQIEDAIRRKVDVFGNQITRDMKEKGIAPAAVTQPTTGHLAIQLASDAEANVLEDVLRQYYRRVFPRGLPNRVGEGVTVALAMDEAYRNELRQQVVRQAVESVRNRIDRYGVGEPDIRLQGGDRIAIELPGLKDPDRALSIMKRTGQLEFRLVDESKKPVELEALIAQARQTHSIPEDYQLETVRRLNEVLQSQLPEQREMVFELIRDPVTRKATRGIPYLVSARAEVTGDLLESAQVSIYNNEPRVVFQFDKTGAKLFGDLTKSNVNRKLAILLDGTLMSAPVIQEPILQGSGEITLGAGDYQSTLREAEDLSLVLQEGALPATLTEATKTVVGPSLGADLIRQGFRSMLLAALVVVIFMAVYYKASGLLADAAVALNVLLLLGALSLFGATLTLPGIAGIILTIGMAVDANVIINERIREELRSGKSVKTAIQSGYGNANRAVIDANITTLIAGIVLYQFGTGPIRGFAVTLSIGILTTLFTAVVFTRVVYDYIVQRWNPQRLSI
ncbi:MAG: protein translocase subunit SecD [Deltaproteobacteria bacterium]|nr:protein translocase subunit SecD [Deltaproteobacteria bacterium]